MDSRSFIGSVSGLFGVALASPIIDTIPEPKQKTSLDVEDRLNNNTTNCLSLQAKYGHTFHSSGREVMRIESSGYTGIGLKQSDAELKVFSMPGPDGELYLKNNDKFDPELKVVSMKPGPDGELYLKINDKWKKVVTV